MSITGNMKKILIVIGILMLWKWHGDPDAGNFIEYVKEETPR
jgi:hypothetical protein